MIIKTENLQEISNKILQAVDTDATTSITSNGDKIELVVVNGQLQLNVTNKEYYARVVIDNVPNEDFRATVDAKVFLNLISKLTTETVELTTNSNMLQIKSNSSNYKLPMVADASNNDGILHLDEILINNVTSQFNISSDILLSILNYNAKEIKANVVQPIQKLFYIDEKGCLTFTQGACVNSFTLNQPIKLLINHKLVKLFKLFKSGDVKFTLGYDQVNDKLIQTKVKFENDDISITAITSTDNTLLNKYPVDKIRSRANGMFEYQTQLSKDELLQALSRLLLVNSAKGGINKDFGILDFKKDTIELWDINKTNKEVINCTSNIQTTYSSILDINSLKGILETCVENDIILNSGNKQCIVLSRGNVKNVLPEVNMN